MHYKIKSNRRIKFAFFGMFLLCFSTLLAQDSLDVKNNVTNKNTIRYNLTPNMLGFKSVIFGYERIVKPYQSFSINTGYLSLGNSGKKITKIMNLQK